MNREEKCDADWTDRHILEQMHCEENRQNGRESTSVQIMSFRLQNRVKTNKKSSPKTEEFLSPKSSEHQKKKKKSLPQFGTKFGRNLLDLFGLTGPFSSDQPALKSRWGDTKFRRKDANSRWGCASPTPPLQFK